MHSNDPDRSSDAYLPRSLAEAYRLQFDRAFRYPFSVPSTLLANAVLTAVLWFWSPRDLFSLFFNVNELFFFPMVLASWMVSDVPATNEYAPDALRILAALDDPTMLTRLLRAKHLVLWTLISPVAFVTALIVATSTGRWIALFFVAAWVITVPLCSLGFSSWVGILWPYHPLGLRQRWDLSLPWTRKWLRWGVLLVLPYGLVPVFGYLAMFPALIAWRDSDVPHHHFRDLILAVSVLAVAPVSIWLWTWSTRYAAALTQRRALRLREYLSHPQMG